MNFKINKNKFYNALSFAARAIASNSPVPILTGILLDVRQDSIIITGSDANISTEITLSNANDEALGLRVIDEGSIVIDTRYLLEIVRKIDSDEISIEILDGTLTHFSGEKAEFKINGYRAGDYPSIDFSEPATRFEISYETLNNVIANTSFAVSNKETRPVLTGINMRAADGKIICTATDSFRLARKIIDVPCAPFSVTVPSKCLNEFRTIFAGETNVRVALDERKIQFRSNSVIMQSTLLEGSFPETDRLIPTEFNSTLVINRRQLISAVDRSSFIKTDNMALIRMEINAADDILISSKSPEIGEYNESVIAMSYEGMPLDITFSGSYLSDALKALYTENVRIKFTESMKPFIILNDNEDESLLQLVLPVRTYN